MRITIPYKKYSFSPPREIAPELLNVMRSTSKIDFQNFIEKLVEEERRQFVMKAPILHRLSVISVTLFAVLASVSLVAFGLSVFGFELLIDKIFMYDPVFFTIAGLLLISFFASFIWLRSYIETYSSFRKYLRAKRRYYMRQERKRGGAGPR